MRKKIPLARVSQLSAGLIAFILLPFHQQNKSNLIMLERSRGTCHHITVTLGIDFLVANDFSLGATISFIGNKLKSMWSRRNMQTKRRMINYHFASIGRVWPSPWSRSTVFNFIISMQLTVQRKTMAESAASNYSNCTSQWTVFCFMVVASVGRWQIRFHANSTHRQWHREYDWYSNGFKFVALRCRWLILFTEHPYARHQR